MQWFEMILRRMDDVMRLEYAGKTDTGQVRKTNQDAFCILQKDDTGLFAVADGMGGYENGEKASRKVIAELLDWWNSFSPVLYDDDFRRMLSAIEQRIEYANQMIYMEWNRNGVCGTTVTVLFIYREQYGVVYAGDSRCYLGQGKKWEQITMDEVWENRTDISFVERKLKKHPARGKLTNAVGVREHVQCRMITDRILPETIFLLCTDGLYKFCMDGVIRNYARKGKDKHEIEQVIDDLMARVYREGAGDNITIIIIKCYSA